MVYYVGYYSCDAIQDEQRVVAPPAENKMNYLISALSEALGEPFEVVSPAQTKAYQLIKGSKTEIQKHAWLKTFITLNSKHKPVRIFGHILTRLSFFLYLVMNVKKDDRVIVYHSLALRNTIRILRKWKKCDLTIEVEELYSDVTENEHQRQKEIAYLQIADRYIFITDLLRREINTEKKSILSHGTYWALPDYGFRFEDDKIHVVYAGTFCKTKGGAYTAIEAAEFLDDRYVLEILGGGSDEENAAVQDLIDEVSKKTDCEIRYVGFKSGEDFDSYIQACHIGLSTQQPGGKFNATSFPSKVLMYMSNGLRVVSVRIPAVETSLVGERVYYYDHQDAQEIAQVIRSVSFDDGYDSRTHLADLHTGFLKQLKDLLFK